MAAENTKEGKWRRRTGGAALGAIAASFFLPPLITLGSPTLWGLGGVFLGLALLGLYNLAVLPAGQVDPEMKWLAWIFGGLALCTIVYSAVDASNNSIAFNERCKSLQTEMLTAVQVKGETVAPDKAHDVFDALGCRPQFN